jgi:hypothetical protein
VARGTNPEKQEGVFMFEELFRKGRQVYIGSGAYLLIFSDSVFEEARLRKARGKRVPASVEVTIDEKSFVFTLDELNTALQSGVHYTKQCSIIGAPVSAILEVVKRHTAPCGSYRGSPM